MSQSASPHLRQPLLHPSDEDSSEPAPCERQSCSSASLDSSLLLKSTAAMSSFAILGAFTSSTGVMLPQIEAFYNLNDVQASACFLAGPFGYVLAAQFNHTIHNLYGRRGIAIFGPMAQCIAAVGIALHPSFPLVLACITLAFSGAGLLDGSWCSWAARQNRANLISGLLHGSFSFGAGCGPVLIELVLAEKGMWYTWYKLLACVCIIELVILVYAFRSDDATKYRDSELDEASSQSTATPAHVFKYKATWVCACYLLVYVGTETAISGWIVTYMLRIRQSSQKAASICSSCFWTGMTVSRMVLGVVSDKFGVKRTTAVYIACALILQILFIIVDDPILSAVLIGLVGFFFGPLFPAAIIRLSELLPPALGVRAVSFVASIGQLGGALLPFGLGALSHLIGLGVFGAVIIAQLAGCLALWMAFPQ